MKPRTRMLHLIRAGAAMLLALVVAGCGPASSHGANAAASASAAPGGSCQHVDTVKFDKTKFVLHAGLAFGAFHHFIYRPYTEHRLHGVLALGKAGLAGLFTVHELKLAKADAESSPTLCKLVAPFDRASAALSGEVDKIKSDKATAGDMDGLGKQVDGLQSGAKSDGVEAPDVIPDDGQLASGGS